MSGVDSSPLSTYNSLMDKHLAGYFCNQRRRKHLVKSGLITKSGNVVSENTYRLNMARKEHKKHVKDLLAQAIVHKALDWERTRQVKIKQKLEEIAKIELVRRMKAECNRTGDEDVLPYLTPRDGDGAHQPRERKRAKSAGARGRRGESGIMIDDDGCPICSREGSQSSRSQSQGKQGGGGGGGGGAGGSGGGGSSKQNKYPKGEIDSRHLYSLDQYALYEYNMTRSDKYNEQSRTSTYLTPLITRPKSMTHQPAPPSKPRPEGGRRPKTSAGDKKMLHPTVPPMTHPEELRSGAEVTLKYYGEHLKLAYEPIGDPRHDVLVDQQPFGGNTLTVFKKPIMPGDTFSFVSTRHRGYPFSLTFYVNGVQNTRLSSCCEYKHKAGAKIGGKAGHFGLVSVTGGIGPCFKCQASGKTKQEKKTDEEKDSDQDDDKKRPKKKSREVKKEADIECEVEDDEDDYDDDFEDEDEKPRGGSSRDDDDESRGGASSSGGRRNDNKDTSPSRGSGRSSNRDRGGQSPGSGRSRDEARDSPVMRSTPSSPDPRPSDDDHYTIEVEQDDEPEQETPKSDKKSARSEPRSEPKSPEPKSPEPKTPEPRSPEPKTPEPEVQSPKSESPESEDQKSDRGAESEPESRPYSRNTLTDMDTPRGVTSEESQDEYPHESSVETMVADKRDIEITNLALTTKQMFELAEIIKARENIVSVVLRNCALDDAGCTQICDAIRHSPSMIKLVNLSANKQLTAGCMAGVGQMLKAKRCLQVLLLHGNPVGDAGIHSLTSTLEDIFHDSARSSPHLEVARVVVQGVMSDLTAEDSDPGYELTHLDIGDTKLTDKSVAPISRIVMLDSTIAVLSLTGCKFTSDGWKTIFEALKTDTNLKKLSLDYTNLRDSLVENLCECLYSHPRLECLDLEGNGLTDRSADSITLLAESNRHIKKVKLLPGNEMSDEALDDLQDVLRRS